MTESELNAIFARVYQQYATADLQPGEFTIRMFSEARNISYNAAAAIIRKAIKAGSLQEIGFRMDGARKSMAFKSV